ncbi:MAG: enoyl-CoA hydratase/isomerase family protein [Nitratireductor sp.]
MMPQTPATITVERDGGVMTIALNRPDVRNAMSLQMVRELLVTLAEAESSGNVRVLILRGEGGHFCSGGDISDMAKARAQPGGEGDDPIARVSSAFGEMCAKFAASDLAIITVVEGVAMGGGFGLACVSDVCIAGQTARFGLPETRLGVVPAQIAPFLVERLGYSKAKLLAVLGGNIHADEALRLGLVHEVAGDVEAALASAVSSILACAPGAVAATKRLLRKARFADPASMIGETAKVFSAAVNGSEGSEGTLAFLQKRKPSWHPAEKGE